ncbi:MAG: RpiB/LacA/LacB family sugar-phosphate isomerase [Acidobacteria bacterium]|nr:RpiB/LacA/LacB family sugar-phosphate isomerase [Acidobacteriota bacterium]
MPWLCSIARGNPDEKTENDEAERGVLICGSGMGASIAAEKLCGAIENNS